MAINATAIMTVELDSTKFVPQIRSLNTQIADIPKNIVSIATLDTSKIAAAVDEAKKKIAEIPSVPVAGIGQKIQAEFTGKTKTAIDDLSASINKVREELANLQQQAGGKKFGIERAGKEIEKFKQSTKDLRKVSQENIVRIVDILKQLPEEAAKLDFDKALNEVNTFTIKSSALFKKFVGNVSAEQLRTGLIRTEKALEQFAQKSESILIDLSRQSSLAAGTVSGEVSRISAAVEQVSGVEKVPIQFSAETRDLTFLQRLKQDIAQASRAAATDFREGFSKAITLAKSGTKAAIGFVRNFRNKAKTELAATKLEKDVALKEPETKKASFLDRFKVNSKTLSGLGKLEKQVDKLANIKPLQRFEFGQAGKALVAEAEAFFGKEAVSRRIFSSIFTFSKASGFVGFVVGKYLEIFADIAKATLLGATKLIERTGNSLIAFTSSFFGKTGQKVGGAMGKVIKFLSVGLQGITSVTINAIQAVFNRFTLALAVALSGALKKAIVKGVLGVGSFLIKSLSTVFNKAKSIVSQIFSVFRFGGGAGGGGEDQINFGQLLGLAGLATTIKLAGNLQEELAKIGTITGQAGASLNRVGQDVVSLSNQVGKNATETARALFDISSAGFKGQEGLIVLRNALITAKGGITEVNVAASAISRTLRAFNLPASEATTVANILFNTVKRGIAPFPELTEQITRVTSIASSAGVSFQQVGAIMANLTRNGQTVEQAITGISAILKAVIAQNKEGTKELDKLGISFTEADVRGKGLIGVFQEIAPAILKNKAAFKQFFGDVTGLKSALVLAQSITSTPVGTESLQADLEAIDARGSAFEASARIADTFNDKMRRFFTLFTNTLRNIGQLLLPIAEKALGAVNGVLEKIANFANLDMESFLKAAMDNIGSIATALFETISKIFSFIQERLFFVFRLFGAIVAGIGNALLPLLETLLSQFVKLIIAAFTFVIKSVVLLVVEFLKSIGALVELLIDRIFGFGTTRLILGFLENLFGAISMMIEDFIIAPIKFVLGLLTGILEFFGLIEGLEEVAKVTVEGVSSGIDKFLNAKPDFENVSSRFKDGFAAVFDQEAKFETTLENSVVRPFENLGKTIVGGFNNIANASTDALRDQAQTIRLLIRNLELTMAEELNRGDSERAAITREFIEKEKDRLGQITQQIGKSRLDEALAEQQRLFEDLVSAEARGNELSQQSLLNQIKENFLVVSRLEKEERDKLRKQQFATTGIADEAIASLAVRAQELFEKTSRASDGAEKLGNVLDEIFGKDVARIAEKFGVGREIAALRTTTQDVLIARRAGFAAEDVDKIIQRSILQQSEVITGFFTSVAKSGKQIFSVEDLKQTGLFDELVKFIDRLEALGATREARAGIFKGRLDEATFKLLDDLRATQDQQTGFIEQTLQRFQGIEKFRELQQKRNELQTQFNQLVGNRSTQQNSEIAQLERDITELEQLIAQIRAENAKKDRAATVQGGFNG